MRRRANRSDHDMEASEKGHFIGSVIHSHALGGLLIGWEGLQGIPRMTQTLKQRNHANQKALSPNPEVLWGRGEGWDVIMETDDPMGLTYFSF